MYVCMYLCMHLYTHVRVELKEKKTVSGIAKLCDSCGCSKSDISMHVSNDVCKYACM
jgi:hypothetical protein